MENTRQSLRRRRAVTGWSHSLPARIAVLGLTAVIWLSGGGHVAASTAASRPAAARSWTVYHGDAAGTGVARSVTAIDTTVRAWTSPVLDGEIYGEPLVWAGRVYVATENDTVYALSAGTGAVLWSAHLGHPVLARSLPCGDITPTVGITGTPVIDRSRHEIFVVADELVRGSPAHVLVGLAATSGRTELTQDVDPAGANRAALLQRTGLTLDAGQVVFGFGGNFGDCAAYRGRLVAVPEKGGTPKVFTVDAAAGESQGAIWMGGAAPAVDRDGHLWVSVGNGSVDSASHPYDDSDSVLELSSSLQLLQFFAPRRWASDNSSDRDMSTEPVLLADGQVMLAGKSAIVYLLRRAHLGGIGGQQATLGQACRQDIDGGSAVVGTTVYLPCASGVIAVRAAQSPPGLRLLWTAGTAGGPPIVAAGLVWTIGPDGTLKGLDPGTGHVRQHVSIGVPANHFPTPSVGDGLLLAASARRVVAFAAAGSGARATAHSSPPDSPAATARSLPTARPAATGSPAAARPAAAGGGVSTAAMIAGVAVGGLAVVGGSTLLIWRRRRSPPQRGGSG